MTLLVSFSCLIVVCALFMLENVTTKVCIKYFILPFYMIWLQSRHQRSAAELINSSSSTSTTTKPEPRPLTYCNLSRAYRYGKHQNASNHADKRTGKSKATKTESSQFSWTMPGTNSKDIRSSIKSVPKVGIKLTEDKIHINSNTLSTRNETKKCLTAGSGLEKVKAISSVSNSATIVSTKSKKSTVLPSNLDQKSVNIPPPTLASKSIDGLISRNKSQLYKSVSVPSNLHIKSDKHSENLNVVNTADSRHSEKNAVPPGGVSISKKLRSHPFMNRSKNINFQNMDADAAKGITSCSQSETDVLKLSKDSVSHSIDTLNLHKVKVNAGSQMTSHKNTATPKNDKSSIVLDKTGISDNQSGNIVEKVECLSFNKIKGDTHGKLDNAIGNPVASKKEIISELNRKLSETSSKILELKKNLAMKTVNDKCSSKSASTCQFENKHPKPTNISKKMGCVSSHNQLVGPGKLTSSIGVSEMNHHKLFTNVSEIKAPLVKNTKESFAIKSRYSLKKVNSDKTPICNSLSGQHQITSEASNEVEKEKASCEPYEIANSKCDKSLTSFQSNSQIAFKSKYKLRKSATLLASNIISSTSPIASTSQSQNPQPFNSRKAQVVKSKYYLRKIDATKSRQNNSASSHLKTNSLRRMPLPVFDSKYKLRRGEKGDDSPSSNVSHVQLSTKILKSKYKLRKVVQNVTQIPKRMPMKTVVNSKYKLRKIPLNKHSYAEGSEWKMNQVFGKSSFYRKSASYWNHYRYKNRQSIWKNSFRNQLYANKKRHNFRTSRFTSQGEVYAAPRNSFVYKSMGHITKHAKAPLIVNKRYVLKRLQTTPRSRTQPAEYLNKHNIKTKEGPKNVKLVVLNGMLYKSSGHSLVRTSQQKSDNDSAVSGKTIIVKKMNTAGMKVVKVRGVKFQMDSTGKTLNRLDTSPTKTGISNQPLAKSAVHRVDIGGMTFVQTKPGTLEQVGSNQMKVVASRVKHKSIVTAAAKFKKDNTKKMIAKKYCMFYNRFGKCQRGDKCPFVHDPDRVAVCTRFLRGTCQVDNCPFSHKLAKEKMPTCSYFLRGVCNRDDCPYRHVNVSKTAKICQDFVKGFCRLGEKCTKKHTLFCPSFSKTGVCSETIPCKLKHLKKTQRNIVKKTSEESSPVDQDKQNLKRKAEEPLEDCDIPFKQRKLPTYISIITDIGNKEIPNKETADQDVVSAIKIRPQLGLK